jgi:hypothetical protein
MKTELYSFSIRNLHQGCASGKKFHTVLATTGKQRLEGEI